GVSRPVRFVRSCRSRDRLDQRCFEMAVRICVDDGGMHVRAAALRPRMSQLARDAVDGFDDLSFRLRLRLETGRLTQRAGGQYSACPRAEILGGEFLAADFSQAAVDILRRDHPALAVAIEVLKRVLPRRALATFDHPRNRPVSHPDGDLDAALALEKKADSGAPDVDVSVAQRGQPERVVLPGVFLVADPEVRGLEQADDGRHDLILRQPVTSQITRDAPPEVGQDLSEAGHAVEFVGVTGLAPARVLAMLLAPPGVPPGCLQMAARAGRDPDVIPRGRSRKRPNPVQGGEA